MSVYRALLLTFAIFIILPFAVFAADETVTQVSPVKETTNVGDLNESIANLQTFMDKAAEYVDTNGKEVAIAEFGNLSGQFVDGNTYLYVYDNNGTVLAHPYSPELVGENRVDDPKIGDSLKQIITVAKNGGGTTYGFYPNPAANNEFELKIFLVGPMIDDEWFYGTGLYTGLKKSDIPSFDEKYNALVDRVNNASTYVKSVETEQALEYIDAENQNLTENDYIFAFSGDGNLINVKGENLDKSIYNSTDDYGCQIYKLYDHNLEDGAETIYELYNNKDETGKVTLRVTYIEPAGENLFVGSFEKIFNI